MTVKMEFQQEKQASDQILRKLAESREPQRTTALLSSLASSAAGSTSAHALRRAVWSLLDAGKIEFTGENKLKLK
jgi:cytochrome P450